MLKAASAAGMLEEEAALMETMLAFKRAGAAAILTYAAKELAHLGLAGGRKNLTQGGPTQGPPLGAEVRNQSFGERADPGQPVEERLQLAADSIAAPAEPIALVAPLEAGVVIHGTHVGKVFVIGVRAEVGMQGGWGAEGVVRATEEGKIVGG
jgi:hypothetical protein